MGTSKLNIEKLFIGGAFLFFLLISMYRLTNASIWFDEAIEYWYSKVMFGGLPFESIDSNSNMYTRILSTYQPPLYNFMMFFWLKISSSEWWFRFFGVVAGFIGMLGLYNCIKILCHNKIIASLSVIFCTCIYQLLYYWQEGAEYCLMLGSLFWTLYFWISLLQESSRKNIILFTIAAIIPVYSQYGAAFPILVMILTAYIATILKRKKKPVIEISVAYVCALIIAALPLYMFFLRRQISNQQGGESGISSMIFETGLFHDIFFNLAVVFRWNFFSYYSDIAISIILAAIAIIFAIVLIKGTPLSRWMIVTNALTWLIYYFAVKLGFYSYGNFGERYNLFFIPLWVITVTAAGYEFYNILGSFEKIKKHEPQSIYLGVVLCFTISFCIWSWTEKIQPNWEKENNRAVVNAWYEQDAADSHTLVYYGASPGFAYYAAANDAYTAETVRNVIYMPWYRDKTAAEYTAYLNSIYGTKWPHELYIAATHYGDDLNTLANQLVNRGWVRADVYNSGGLLIRLTGGE